MQSVNPETNRPIRLDIVIYCGNLRSRSIPTLIEAEYLTAENIINSEQFRGLWDKITATF
jgi:hypothetical protein